MTVSRGAWLQPRNEISFAAPRICYKVEGTGRTAKDKDSDKETGEGDGVQACGLCVPRSQLS